MVACRICHNPHNLEIVEAKELFIGTRDIFAYLFCQKCRSLSIKNYPINLAELYSKYPVFEFNLAGIGRWKQFMRSYMILNKNILARIFYKCLNSWEDLAFKSLHGICLNKSMRILDVGCGNGMLIKLLKSYGFKDVTGIDPHLKQSIESPGFRILKAKLNDLKEDFDVVMCHHSFEHMENVGTDVKYLDNLTKSGGTLIIRIPNIESYSFRKYKGFWHGIHAPFHFILPSAEGMNKIFQNTSLKLKETRQEQLLELFLYNIDYSLDIALTEPQGVITYLGEGPLGKKIPPPFTKKDISYLKEKSAAVVKSNMADYIAYYYKKE